MWFVISLLIDWIAESLADACAFQAWLERCRRPKCDQQRGDN